MNGLIITNAGLNLLAKAITGKTLNFTKCVCGDGWLGTRNPKELTALISQKRELSIQRMTVASVVGTAEFFLEMTNKGLTTGFFVREFGLIARDPDTNADVLYAYCNKGNDAGYIEPDNNVDQINYTLSLVTVIDQAKHVTAVINNTNQYVTYARLDQRFDDLYAPYTNPAGFWTTAPSGDKRLRPITIPQTKELLLGGIDPAALDKRLERVEDALSELWLAVETQQDFDGFSHFMAEDFTNTSMIDTFRTDMIKVTAGSWTAEAEPADGLIPGSWYWLTDGVSSERVQVTAITEGKNSVTLKFDGPVMNTYRTDGTMLCRTTAKIKDGEATGAGVLSVRVWPANFEWQGLNTSTDFERTFEFSVADVGRYTLSGFAKIMGVDWLMLAE